MEAPVALSEPVETYEKTSESVSGIVPTTSDLNSSEPADPNSEDKSESQAEERIEGAKQGSEHEEEIDEEEEKEDDEEEKKRDDGSEGRNKRERKKVERLSESLNKRYEAEQSKQEKANEAISSQLQGHGKPLGEIPLVEASITKSKPVDLKLLHSIIYGRAGSANEIRSNLRRFRGFSFAKNSSEFIKREQNLNKKTVKEVRNTLRILHMQVTGSLGELVTRLLEFLLNPSPDMVKYKGKLYKKPRKSSGKKTNEKTPKKKGEKKTTSAKSPASVSRKRKAPTTDDEEEDDENDLNSSQSEDEEDDNKSASFDSAKKSKKEAKVEKKPTIPKSVEKVVPSTVASKVTKPSPNPAKKSKRIIESDSEDELPLMKMVIEKPVFPTDEELKKRVMEVLKTANLQETSMKAVRNSIFNQYEGTDLSSKKQLINDTIKEYLSSSV